MNKHQQPLVRAYRFLGLVFLTVITLVLVLSIEGAGAREGQAAGYQHQGGLAQAGQADAAVASGVAPQRPAGCVNGQPYSDVEPNSTITEAQYLSSINTTEISAGIVPTGDIDYFGFDATAGDRIWAYAYTLSATNSADSRLHLLNSISQTIQWDDDNGSQSSQSSAIAGAYITQTGITYLRASTFFNNYTMQPYRLFVDRTSSATIAETESNNAEAFADDYAFGTVMTGTIGSITDKDIYSFTATVGDRLVIQVDGDPERDNTQFNPNIFFHGPTGPNYSSVTVDNDATFCSVDCAGTIYRSENLFWNVTTTGIHYAWIYSDTSGPLPTGSYNLHIFVASTANCPTATPTSALTSTSTATNTATNTRTSTATNTITHTATSTATRTATSTSTPTATTTASSTHTRTSTSTVTIATATVTSTATPPNGVPTATSCAIQFNDVPPSGSGSTFYSFVRCLACRGIVSGYACGAPTEPCPGSFFRPGVNVTRGQISKMVAIAAELSSPAGTRKFEDVPGDSPFYLWIQQLANTGAIGGYPCGGTNPSTGAVESCVAPGNLAYFRPNNNTTRGQLTKIVSEAADFTEDPGSQQFADVPADAPFFVWVQRLSNRGVVSGYPCGGTNSATGAPEPCDTASRPYFRVNNNVTRGQTAKIVAETFFPNCQTPASR